MAQQQKSTAVPQKMSCSAMKENQHIDQDKGSTSPGKDDLLNSPSLWTKQAKQPSQDVDSPLLHTISAIGNEDSDEGEVPYPDSNALLARFWDMKVNIDKEGDDVVEYVGSNSIDSGYKSPCDTPDLQYHCLINQENKVLEKRGSVSSLSSTGSTGSTSKFVPNAHKQITQSNVKLASDIHCSETNKRRSAKPSPRISSNENSKSEDENRKICMQKRSNISNLDIIRNKLMRSFQSNANSSSLTATYGSTSINPVRVERRPRSSSPVSRCSSIRRKRHHSGDIEVCNNDISSMLPTSQKVGQNNDCYSNEFLVTLDNPQRINGLDPPHNVVQGVSTINGDCENKCIVHSNAEEEIDSIFYGFSPTKDFRNGVRSEETLKNSFQLPSTSQPPKHLQIEETAIYSPAVTQCVLDVLGGYKKTSTNHHTFPQGGGGGPVFGEHSSMSRNTVQGPSTFLQEYLENNIQTQHRYRHHSSDSDCSSISSHLYEEIIYGPVNQKIAESPPTPPPLPPPLPARPAHIFKNSTPLKQCDGNKSQCLKVLPKEKHQLHTKQIQQDNSKVNSKDKYPQNIHERKFQFPIPSEGCKITQGIQMQIATSNSGNQNNVNHSYHLQNRCTHATSGSQVSLNNPHQTRQKPIPPPKPPKPSRTSAMAGTTPVSTKCISSTSAQSSPVAANQGHINKDSQSPSKQSQKPSQRSNIYSIFKDRDSRRCLSASLHQESSDQLEEQIQRNTDIMEQLKSAMRISVMDCDDDYGFKVVPQII